jgi:hypothetical protein
LKKIIGSDHIFRDTIIDTIIRRINGISGSLQSLLTTRILLAHLYIDSLAKKHNHRDVRDALKSLPEKSNDTYDEMMDRICSQDGEDANLAKQILML